MVAMDIKIDTQFYYKMHHWKVYGTRAVAIGDRIQFRFLLKKVGAVTSDDWEWIDADDVRVVSTDKGTVHIVPKEEVEEEISHADS